MCETIKERTIAFVKSKGITMKKFEQACGLSSIYINYNNRSVDEANRKVIDFINNL